MDFDINLNNILYEKLIRGEPGVKTINGIVSMKESTGGFI